VLMLVAVSGAELVRMSCRRQMLSAARPRTAAPRASATRNLQLSR
jgi:hypothetical protein